MQKEKTKKRAYLIALAVVVLVIVVLIVIYAAGSRDGGAAVPAVTPRPTAEVKIRERLVEKLVEVEKEITVEEISSGLNDMGVLVTEEYYFTDVVNYSSIKTLFSVELGITASSYLASYDGVVTAGVDFAGITVEKDEGAGTVTVTLPAAEIFSVDIDPTSFCLYSEKTGLGNPISVEDFNDSVVALEAAAREKALARGILEQADENARKLVRNFITPLLGDSGYVLRIATK